MKIVAQILILLTINFIISCSSTATSRSDDDIKCIHPRPEICAMDYNPVCAIQDNAVRCVTTPCSSAELVSYSNGCSACADKNVISYTSGECKK